VSNRGGRGNADDAAATKKNRQQLLTGWDGLPSNMKLLNLLYDLTPSSLVSGIVTEFGIVPPSSVAVLLREMYPQQDILMK